MNLIFVQYGDYREAYERFTRGGPETYYAQRFTVDFVGGLAQRFERVVVICVNTPAHEATRLANGVITIGLPLYAGATPDDLLQTIEDQQPTHLILRSPMEFVLKRAIRKAWTTLPLFADSFESTGLRAYLRKRRLRKVLNHHRIQWIGNHGLMAARSLCRMGVPASKVLPYDVPPPATPQSSPPKHAPAAGDMWRLLFAGALKHTKGIGDAIDAVGLLHRRGHKATLTVLGEDHGGQFRTHAADAGLSEHILFKGRVGHDMVLGLMRQHHAVLVPSRHEYPEGIPYVVYDAYCSRTPPISSDHPMLVGNIVDGESGLIAKAGSAPSLADACARLLSDPALYQRLSNNSFTAWQRLQMKVEWSDLINRFLDGPDKHIEWLQTHCLRMHDARGSDPKSR
ncbi:MAG: glycosyltransferase family 4 protein [Phycisphaeraceae bacterium]